MNTPASSPSLEERAERLEAANAAAQAAALPGPAALAFSGRPLTFSGLTLRPVVNGDLYLLQRLGNGFAGVAESIVNPSIPMPAVSYPELCQVLYLFSLGNDTVEEWDRDIERNGEPAAEAFRQAARLATARVTFAPIQLVQTIRENIERGFATVLQTGRADGEGAGPGNASRTASAGASPSSAGLPSSATVPPAK